ncbi:MAG TPA: hypothetical protein VFQ23_12985 [Anaerolineales bacterium]|nr:hypothetical protein [Anaerolineales bacterium]
MKTWFIRFRFLVMCIVILSLLIPQGTVHAWKPRTHVFLAEIALQDALDDGMLTIYATDYANGRVLNDLGGKPRIIGSYPVDPVILTALKSNAAQFRAGVLGPDAYPDIATGQQIIHPAGKDTPGQPSGVDINAGGPGSGPWLEYLYSRAFTGCNPDGSACNAADKTPANQAFVMGFLAHAAGDMYGHTFINYYTGGPFHFSPKTENAIKHIVLEGYIEKRTPQISYDANIDAGVDQFIYRNMIKAAPNSYLVQKLLTGTSTEYSLPYIYSQLRNQLQKDIDAYYATKKNYDKQAAEIQAKINACGWLDWSCSNIALGAQLSWIQTQKGYYVTQNAAQITYKEAWRDDIDQGLAALPQMSHKLAKALFFNPNEMDKAQAQAIIEDYVLNHLTSMGGAPDFAGQSIYWVKGVITQVLNALGITWLKDAIDQAERDLLNYLMMNALGFTVDDIEKYLKDPATQFDPTLNSSTFNVEGTGHLISLQSFNADQLHITDTGNNNPAERFDYQKFPAAFNTVVMIKLSLMSQAGIRQLMTDLGDRGVQGVQPPGAVIKPNILLGYIETLDGGNQWIVNGHSSPGVAYLSLEMIFARSCQLYQKIFMQQVGASDLMSACQL